MTDEHNTTPPEAPAPEILAPETPAETPPAPQAAPKRGGTPLWLTILLVAAVGAEPFVLPKFLPDLLPPPPPPALAPAQLNRVTALETALSGVKQRLDALEAAHSAAPAPAAPPPPRADMQPGVPAEAAPTDVARLDALEARLNVLEKQPGVAMADVSGQIATASAALDARISALDERIKTDVAQAAARAATASRLRAASAALAAGQPLGDIPGAGPELARFATTAPPTEATLRLSFQHYAEAAHAASDPAQTGSDMLDHAIERIEALVTIRQGDKVLVGNTAAVLLETARAKLDVGDLPGALATLAKLDTPAQNAMAPWMKDAQSLIDARAALLALVAKS